MESLFIVLLDGRVCMFESVDDRFDSVCIKGEANIQLKKNQVDWCIREILGNLGVDDLQEWSVTVIYDPVTSDLLSPVIAGLLPHKPSGLEIRILESLMPELLLKCKMISPGQTVTVALGTRCWQVTLTEEGRVSEVTCIENVAPDERLSECDIPGALRADYTFTTNRTEFENVNEQLKKMTSQCLEKTLHIVQLQKNIENIERTELQNQLNINLKDELLFDYESAINELIHLLIPITVSEKIKAVVGARIFYNDCSSMPTKLLELASSTSSSILIEKLYSRIKFVYGKLLKKETLQYFLINNKCTAEILIELSRHDDFEIRKMVAKHQNSPSHLLKLLIDDKRKEVRDIANSRISNTKF
jgi:hypothetical protein